MSDRTNRRSALFFSENEGGKLEICSSILWTASTVSCSLALLLMPLNTSTSKQNKLKTNQKRKKTTTFHFLQRVEQALFIGVIVWCMFQQRLFAMISTKEHKPIKKQNKTKHLFTSSKIAYLGRRCTGMMSSCSSVSCDPEAFLSPTNAGQKVHIFKRKTKHISNLQADSKSVNFFSRPSFFSIAKLSSKPRKYFSYLFQTPSINKQNKKQ